MKAKIAVATVSGRAYYELVTELNRKHLPFISLKPWDPVPMHVKVVLTTSEESSQVSHHRVLCFIPGTDPESVVDEALMIVQGKEGYEKVVVGVDPGKTYGVAVLGDNKVLSTLTASSMEEAAHLILDNLSRFPAEAKVVRVGDGPPEFTKALLNTLNRNLPEDALIEIVSEAGTSSHADSSVNRRVLRDAASAIKIAGRNGRVFNRKNVE